MSNNLINNHNNNTNQVDLPTFDQLDILIVNMELEQLVKHLVTHKKELTQMSKKITALKKHITKCEKLLKVQMINSETFTLNLSNGNNNNGNIELINEEKLVPLTQKRLFAIIEQNIASLSEKSTIFNLIQNREKKVHSKLKYSLNY